MKKQKREFKKRYFFLIIILAVIFAVSAVAVYFNSQVYTERLYPGEFFRSVSDYSVKIENPDIVALKSVNNTKPYGSFDLLNFTFEGRSSGETTVSIYQNQDGKVNLKRDFRVLVLPGGFVFNSTAHEFNGYFVLFPSLLLSIFLVAVFFGRSFIEKQTKGEFSYSMVALGGAWLYSIGILLNLILYWAITSGNDRSFGISSFNELCSLLVYGGIMFAIITFPILLILAVAVSLSNLWLIRHEGVHPLNLLGMIFGFTIIAAFAFIVVFSSSRFLSDPFEYKVYSAIDSALQYAFCYLECMLFSTIVCAVMATRYKVPYSMDYIIILGCAIRSDGTPTPILRGRIDRAFEYEQAQFQATGKHACFVPSGGMGSDEIISEAESMKRCLLSLGVPEERILKEDKSVNTRQNMEYSKRIINENTHEGEEPAVAFSTTNYHVFRGYILAKKIGLKAWGLSAKTKLYYYPNAFVREFIGLLFEERWRHLFYAGITALSFAVLAFIMM